MEYKDEIIINLPIEKVTTLFDNPDNMSKWQPELQSFTNLSGTPGKEGAISKLVYRMGHEDIDMIETITKNNLPDEFCGTYEAKGVLNEISNRFENINGIKTKWISHNIFHFKGFTKVLSALMPNSFRKQSYKYMKQFKEFAENSN